MAGRYEAPVPFELRTGEVRRNLVVRSPRTTTVAGRLIRAGRPLVGGILSAGPAGGGRSSPAQFSQPDGHFILHGVPLGESRLRVHGHRVVSPSTLSVGREGLADLTVEVAKE